MTCIPSGVLRRWICAAVLLLPAGGAFAATVTRTLKIEAPATAAAGASVRVVLVAGTAAGAGEQIGFLHAEFSTDGGRTWTGVCYDQNAGDSLRREVACQAGGAGTKLLVRARAAFRGGVAGDVDYTGAAIKWEDTWGRWASPPAKTAVVAVQ